MNYLKKAFLLVPVLSLLVACGDPKIDGTNFEKFKQSLDVVKKELPQQEINALEAAVMDLPDELVMREERAGRKISRSDLELMLLAEVNKKTADEIIDLHRELRKDGIRFELKAVDGKIEEQRSFEELLSKFEVVEIKYDKETAAFARDYNITFSTKNATSEDFTSYLIEYSFVENKTGSVTKGGQIIARETLRAGEIKDTVVSTLTAYGFYSFLNRPDELTITAKIVSVAQGMKKFEVSQRDLQVLQDNKARLEKELESI